MAWAENKVIGRQIMKIYGMKIIIMRNNKL